MHYKSGHKIEFGERARFEIKVHVIVERLSSIVSQSNWDNCFTLKPEVKVDKELGRFGLRLCNTGMFTSTSFGQYRERASC